MRWRELGMIGKDGAWEAKASGRTYGVSFIHDRGATATVTAASGLDMAGNPRRKVVIGSIFGYATADEAKEACRQHRLSLR